MRGVPARLLYLAGPWYEKPLPIAPFLGPFLAFGGIGPLWKKNSGLLCCSVQVTLYILIPHIPRATDSRPRVPHRTWGIEIQLSELSLPRTSGKRMTHSRLPMPPLSEQMFLGPPWPLRMEGGSRGGPLFGPCDPLWFVTWCRPKGLFLARGSLDQRTGCRRGFIGQDGDLQRPSVTWAETNDKSPRGPFSPFTGTFPLAHGQGPFLIPMQGSTALAAAPGRGSCGPPAGGGSLFPHVIGPPWAKKALSTLSDWCRNRSQPITVGLSRTVLVMLLLGVAGWKWRCIERTLLQVPMNRTSSSPESVKRLSHEFFLSLERCKSSYDTMCSERLLARFRGLASRGLNGSPAGLGPGAG